MTDFCHIVSISFNSTLRCTSLSKSHWLFFIFGTLGVSIFCHRTWALPESPLDFLSVVLRFNLFEAVKNGPSDKWISDVTS